MTEKKSELSIQPRRKESVSMRIASLAEKAGGVANLAKLAGVSDTAVRKWKSGESEPTVSRLVRLARCMGVDVGWLATGEGDPEAGQAHQVKEEPEASYAAAAAAVEHFDAEVVDNVLRVLMGHRKVLPESSEDAAQFIIEIIRASQKDRNKAREEAWRMLEQGPPQPDD